MSFIIIIIIVIKPTEIKFIKAFFYNYFFKVKIRNKFSFVFFILY